MSIQSLPCNYFTPHKTTPVHQSPQIVQSISVLNPHNETSLYDAALFQLEQIRYLHSHFSSKKAESWYIQKSIENMTVSVNQYQHNITELKSALQPGDSQNTRIAYLIRETLGLTFKEIKKPSDQWSRSISGFDLMVLEMQSAIPVFKTYLKKTEKREGSCTCKVS